MPINSRMTDADISFAFRFFDSQNNGTLDKVGLLRAVKALGWTEATSTDITKVLTSLNKRPENNTVNLKEFTEVVRQRAIEPGSAAEVARAFQLFDMDGKGRITKENLRAIGKLVIGSPVSDEYLDEMMKLMDTKRDGVIDIDEFRATVAPELVAEAAQAQQQQQQHAKSETHPQRGHTPREQQAHLEQHSSSQRLSSQKNAHAQQQAVKNSSMERKSSVERFSQERRSSQGRMSSSSTSPTGALPLKTGSFTKTTSPPATTTTKVSSFVKTNSPPSSATIATTGKTSSFTKMVVDASSAQQEGAPSSSAIVTIGNAKVTMDMGNGTLVSRSSVRSTLQNLGYQSDIISDDDFLIMFKSHDHDNDGALTKTELTDFLISLGEYQ